MSLPFDFYLSLRIRKPASLPKRFREKGLVGHRLLTTERIVNERVLALDLVGKVGVRHVPWLRTFLVGRVALEIPFLTFTVVPRLHPFNTCILFHFNSQACPCLQQVCDPLIH